MFAASARRTWPTLTRAILSHKPRAHCVDPVVDTLSKDHVRRLPPQSPISLAGPYAHAALIGVFGLGEERRLEEEMHPSPG